MDIKELQELNAGQLHQIFSLRQEIEKQKEEIKHLKELLVQAVPVISTVPMTDEEYIARVELAKLKQKSDSEILTYEEAKKVELYFKVIRTILSPKESEQPGNVKEYSTADLLSQIKDN